MLPVEGLKSVELIAENKALMRKKVEIAERQAAISAEMMRRSAARKADGRLMGMNERDIDELDSAVQRMKARRANAKLEKSDDL